MTWNQHHSRYHCCDLLETLYLIAAPSPDDIVSLADIKKHMNVEASDTDKDDVLTAYRDAAISYLDGRDGLLQRALAEQTWELKLSRFPAIGVIHIPLPPLIEVMSVAYIDENEAPQTLDPALYHVTGVGNRGRITLASRQSWPRLTSEAPERVTVQFRAGYVDGGVSPPEPNVPKAIIQAIKLLTGTMFDNRESILIGQTAVELPWAVQALLRPYQVF